MRFDDAGKLERFNQFYPNTVILIGAKSKEGRANVMPSAWHTALSRDPLLYGVSVSPKRYTYDLIRESGEFTVNFTGAKFSEFVRFAGSVSGRDVDKLSQYGVAYTDGVMVAAPVLTEAYCCYECKVDSVCSAGDHDLIVGKIVGLHIDDDTFGEHGVLRLENTEIDLYMGAYTYARLDRSTSTRTAK